MKVFFIAGVSRYPRGILMELRTTNKLLNPCLILLL
jgi:hypothetical protein